MMNKQMWRQGVRNMTISQLVTAILMIAATFFTARGADLVMEPRLGDVLILPFGEGMAYPVEADIPIQAPHLRFSNGMELSMGFFGRRRGGTYEMIGVADTLRAGARCLDAGVNAAAWNRTLFLTKTQARLHLEAYLTETAEFYAGGTVCICALPQSKLDELHITEDEIDDISGFPRDIAGVEVGAMLRDVADGAKISLRTYENLDASAVCRIIGGGGHRAAAGATVSGTLADARAALLNALISCGIEL